MIGNTYRAYLYCNVVKSVFHIIGSIVMTSATNSGANQMDDRGLLAKIAQVATFVASTVLMAELHESLDTQTSGDKSDAAFKYGM